MDDNVGNNGSSKKKKSGEDDDREEYVPEIGFKYPLRRYYKRHIRYMISKRL